MFNGLLDDEGRLLFDTAWSAPHPVVAAMAKSIRCDLRHEWADEDTGNNVGVATYLAGDYAKATKLDGTRQGYELAFELRGGRDLYVWTGETYEYRNDEQAQYE